MGACAVTTFGRHSSYQLWFVSKEQIKQTLISLNEVDACWKDRSSSEDWTKVWRRTLEKWPQSLKTQGAEVDVLYREPLLDDWTWTSLTLWVLLKTEIPGRKHLASCPPLAGIKGALIHFLHSIDVQRKDWKALVTITVWMREFLELNEQGYSLFFIKWVLMSKEWLFHCIFLCTIILSK